MARVPGIFAELPPDEGVGSRVDPLGLDHSRSIGLKPGFAARYIFLILSSNS